MSRSAGSRTERREPRAAASGDVFRRGSAFLIDVIEGASMKSFSVICGVLVLGSVLSPVVANADVARAKRAAAAQSLSIIERSVLAPVNDSYLHGAFAGAVEMKEGRRAVSVLQPGA